MYVLIIDSQPLFRKGIEEALSDCCEKPDFMEVGHINDALDILRDIRIDIAFVDLRMGSEEIGSRRGLELIEKVRKQGDSRAFGSNRTKFILMATSLSLFEFKRAKELGVDGYVLKDAAVEDLQFVFNVVKRGEKFYPSHIVETFMCRREAEDIRLLTEREWDVFSELCKGLTNSQISNNLYITEGTTKKHVSSILNKLKMSSRMEVVVYANKVFGR